MILKLCFVAIIAIASCQDVKEKGNLDDLIGDVFGKNEPQPGVANEKVRIFMISLEEDSK